MFNSSSESEESEILPPPLPPVLQVATLLMSQNACAGRDLFDALPQMPNIVHARTTSPKDFEVTLRRAAVRAAAADAEVSCVAEVRGGSGTVLFLDVAVRLPHGRSVRSRSPGQPSQFAFPELLEVWLHAPKQGTAITVEVEGIPWRLEPDGDPAGPFDYPAIHEMHPRIIAPNVIRFARR